MTSEGSCLTDSCCFLFLFVATVVSQRVGSLAILLGRFATVGIKSEGIIRRKLVLLKAVFFSPFVPAVEDQENISLSAVLSYADDVDSTAGRMG